MDLDIRSDLPKTGIGILGGTGLYEMEGLEILEEVFLETPFGKPSEASPATMYSSSSTGFSYTLSHPCPCMNLKSSSTLLILPVIYTPCLSFEPTTHSV